MNISTLRAHSFVDVTVAFGLCYDILCFMSTEFLFLRFCFRKPLFAVSFASLCFLWLSDGLGLVVPDSGFGFGARLMLCIMVKLVGWLVSNKIALV